MDNRRLLLLLVFSFSLVMLWDAWLKHTAPKTAVVPAQTAQPATAATPGAVPSATASAPAAGVPPAVSGVPAAVVSGPVATIRTDRYIAKVAAQGGDLVSLELLEHPDTQDKSRPFQLFDTGSRHVYLGQSGLIGADLPNHRSTWSLSANELTLADGQDELVLTLSSMTASGGEIKKTYRFRRGSYEIAVEHAGVPTGAHVYHQITRDGKPGEGGDTSMAFGVHTFTGPAVYTEAGKFQKVEFSALDKGDAKYVNKAADGWLAMVQHYFVAAWLPPAGLEREFYLRKIDGGLYSMGIVTPVGADGTTRMTLYAGPQEQAHLDKIAPGLALVVDYGWLTVIAAPLFWVLQLIHQATGNWGWAIIGLTVLLKLIFFPLSAASYKSMAKMKVLTPKLMKLKETYGDDKQRLNREMMELYKKEKVNPLGGCLPVLVQIPVFIALYWVLLGAVEMRNAPWLGWITDLSVKDPYYVLPLLMGATMFIQTKLNPTPPDPIQAKVMLFMPIIFTFMFLWFPSGLVLYWTVNNLLSIAQQWQINRMIDTGKAA
jgi:YidC/Oxa1 family membrane protein insertase